MTYYNIYISQGYYSRNPNDIVNMILEKSKISREDLLSRKRNRPIVYARHSIAFHLKEQILSGKITYKDVANLTGRESHATIMHSIKEAQSLIDTRDKLFRNYLL